MCRDGEYGRVGTRDVKEEDQPVGWGWITFGASMRMKKQ